MTRAQQAQLITLLVFSVFSLTYLREDFRCNYVIAFAFFIAVMFWKPQGILGK